MDEPVIIPTDRYGPMNVYNGNRNNLYNPG